MDDYEQKWCSPEGETYRKGVFNRQRREGLSPLVDNPTIDEVRETLQQSRAKTVLDIGCGWGRWLEQLNEEEFIVTGCDVSSDMLALVPKHLRAFQLDLTQAIDPKVGAWTGTVRYPTYPPFWDVGLLRGVLHYLLSNPEKWRRVVENLHQLVRYKIFVWELPEVCEELAKWNSPLFDLRPIQRKDE